VLTPESSTLPDAAELAAQWQRAGEEWTRFWTQPLARTTHAAAGSGAPAMEMPAFAAPAAAPGGDAVALLDRSYAERLAALWRTLAESQGNRLPELAPAPAPDDHRFDAPEWHCVAWFSWLRQAYLIHADYVRARAALLPLPAPDAARLMFYLRQYLDALAPTNFLAGNPEATKRALETGGTSLVHGAANLVADLRRGRITMSDPDAFEVGRNLAVTPGSVVFRNELIELLQYAATTPTVARRPLVIVPPCINKCYILDLRPEDSFVRHVVAQGHTTFMVSWRNIPADLGGLTFDDYLAKGVLPAIAAAQEISGSRTVNALGFCVGGTLLASALAVLAARHDRSVASLTLLATMLDFADPGEIGVYITPEFMAATEPALLAGARMPGNALAGAFSSLRANDLVWRYVTSCYLEGRTPPAFDLLHWNTDSTSLPGPMYAYYLREMYVANRLCVPRALTMLDEPVDLGSIRCPAYVMASRSDHIVPWKSAWRSTALLGGDTTFVLGASGHIAGVVNPPEPPRRNYWTNDLITDDPDAWLARANAVKGSWWPHWWSWLEAHRGGSRAAPRHAGSRQFPALAAAPGDYVREINP
jgi:polyhydroxyalkanoate synthase subunit PhaC